MVRTLRLSLVLVLIAGGLAACGKRGQLEPPGGQKQGAEEAAPANDPAGQTKIGGKKRIPITAPKRDLPIDFILEWPRHHSPRHCEKQSAEAIQACLLGGYVRDGNFSGLPHRPDGLLAMTPQGIPNASL